MINDDIKTTPLEQPGSGLLETTRQGKTGTRTWLCHASYVYNHPKLPKVNISKFNDNFAYPDSTNNDLVCVLVSKKPVENSGSFQVNKLNSIEGLYLVTANYATAAWLDSTPKENYDAYLDVLEVGVGRTWSDGTPCDSQITMLIPCANYTISRILGHYDSTKNTISRFEGSVNKNYWKGFRPETLLFEGCTIETTPDYERGLFWDTVTYKFTYNSRGWNIAWKSGEQARNSDGSLIYIGNYPVFVSAGRWDRPTPQLYELGDFMTLTGIK